MAKEKISLRWKAAEYEYREKTPGWFLAVGAISVVLLVIALLQKNFFFAVFIIFAAVIVMVFGKRRPAILEFYLDDEEIGVGKASFKYNELDGFSVRRRPGHLNEIVLKKKTVVSPFLRIPIDSKLAAEAEQLLGEKLPQTEYQESLVDVFAEWFGF